MTCFSSAARLCRSGWTTTAGPRVWANTWRPEEWRQAFDAPGVGQEQPLGGARGAGVRRLLVVDGHGPARPIDIGSLPKLPFVGAKPRSKVLDIVLPIATAAFVLGVVAVVILLVRRRSRYAEVREDWEVEFGPHRFTYKDLFRATEGFKNKTLLGFGGFGRVYKGVLPKSKLEVAVKKVSHESRQGIKEFVAEVVTIGRLRHRNMVQLLGYCRRKGELLLVYDYMSNGSLDKYLYGGSKDKEKTALDWAQRFRIIKGVASGLPYTHEDFEQVIIHRDIKASNVLSTPT
uniref:non-specific serine/threonine protein kinase n=1 Tax=Aegilops tauschii subsp. strangulata TaxID=200361 RepID=A0A453LX02_AEGTS